MGKLPLNLTDTDRAGPFRCRARHAHLNSPRLAVSLGQMRRAHGLDEQGLHGGVDVAAGVHLKEQAGRGAVLQRGGYARLERSNVLIVEAIRRQRIIGRVQDSNAYAAGL